jgi:hypothetical protein
LPDRIGRPATAAIIAALGFAVGLAGDATHVASGTTQYEWDDVPTIWKSAFWFPLLIAFSVTATAYIADRAGLTAARTRTRAEVPAGAAAVLALYAITAVIHDEPATVSVTLTGAIAVAIWSWWDPSKLALFTALAAALLGPLAEMAVVEIGAASYSESADDLAGVAPWLPCLYFAAGAVASGLWAAVERPLPSAPERP